jgi:acylphosphatase
MSRSQNQQPSRERQGEAPMTLFPIVLVQALLATATVSPTEEPGKEPPPETIARLVHYAGRVQGVGFRATAVEIAKGFPITGWVKNLDDGRVQLLVEGPQEPVKKFLAAIRTRWGKNIEKEQVEEKKPSGEFKDFSIRR